jgi:hypothetical protein
MSEHKLEITSGVNENAYGWACLCGMSSGLVYPTRDAATAAWEDHRTMTPPSGKKNS